VVTHFILQAIKKDGAAYLLQKTPPPKRRRARRELSLPATADFLPDSSQWHISKVSTPTKFKWHVRQFAHNMANETEMPEDCPFEKLDRVEIDDVGDKWEAAVLQANM